MSAEKAILNILTNDAGVTALVGQRVRPIIEHQKQALPYVTYQAIATDHVETMDGSAGLAMRSLQINCYSSTALEAEAIIEAVRVALQGKKGTYNGVVVGGIINADGPRDLPQSPNAAKETMVYAKSVDFDVWFTEAIPA